MAILFKTRGMALPTLIFRKGKSFIEFTRTTPDRFEYQTDDEETIKFLTDMGYQLHVPEQVEQVVETSESESSPETPNPNPPETVRPPRVARRKA